MTTRWTYRLLALLLVLASALPASAQTGTVIPSPIFTGFDNSGDIVSLGKLCSYLTGTVTPANTYTTSALSVANSNPVILDSAGRHAVFLTPGVTYTFILMTPGTDQTCNTGSVLWTANGIGAVPTSSANLDVLGTAGEAITAGQCVYLSDGSGAKTAGQWFKCDSGNTYSSTTPSVGMAPNSITISTVGTVRLAGQVTGLSSLTVGQPYFITTGGSITATAPLNKRKLGDADSTSSLILSGNPRPITPTAGTLGQVITSTGATTDPTFQGIGFVNDFRLSLTTATCETTADVTAATTLYWTPCDGNRITVFNSSSLPETCTTAELSIAIPATTSQMYDVWVYDSSFGTCAMTLELLAWSSDTARATAIARVSGRWTKTGDPTRLYLGSIRTTAVSGQTEDSFAKRYIWNYYNRKVRGLRVTDATGTWQYNGVLRQARATATNQLDVVIGVAEVLVHAEVHSSTRNANIPIAAYVSIGYDSTTTTTAGTFVTYAQSAVANIEFNPLAVLDHFPAVGRHVYVWLEQSDGATQTWYGTNAPALSGISGWMLG